MNYNIASLRKGILYISLLSYPAIQLQNSASAQDLITRDAELIRVGKEQKINIFVDTTEDFDTDISKDDSLNIEAQPDEDHRLAVIKHNLTRFAVTHKLSLLQRTPDTLLMWPRGNVVSLAKRILEGESLQIVESDELLPDSATIFTSLLLKAHNPVREVNPNDVENSLISEGKLSSSLRLIKIAQSLKDRPELVQTVTGENEPRRWSYPLSQFPTHDQRLILNRAQGFMLRMALNSPNPLWLNNSFWSNATLTIQQAQVSAPRGGSTIPSQSRTPVYVLAVQKMGRQGTKGTFRSRIGVSGVQTEATP